MQAILLSRKFRATTGVDISESILRRASERINRFSRNRIQFLCGDLRDLRLDLAQFEAIVSFNVLQLIPHWRETLGELFCLLRPGGQLIVCVDSLEAMNDAAIVQAHRKAYRVHHYSAERDLAQILRELGFRKV